MKKKIAIVHPELGFVGTEAVAIWIMEALKKDFGLTLITTAIPDFDKLNIFFGSSLDKNISIVNVPLPKVLTNTVRVRLLKLHFLMKYCKKHKTDFDLFFSSYGEMDFGKRGIQYIHFPEINTEAKFVLKSHFYRDSLPRRIYQRLGYMISGYSKDRVKNNLTLANSKWTKKIIDDFYSIESIVVYPPVLDDFEKVKWEEKENGFIFIGRISPDKRPLEIIQILKKVREKGHDIHIYILGNVGMDLGYVEKVKHEAKVNPWIFYKGKVPRDKLRDIVSKQKFGINGKKYEHFGIVVAEMIKAGSIVFVPNNGGQVEIVNRNEKLVYNTDEDAVKKIIQILVSKKLQDEIRNTLKLDSLKYSVSNFKSQIRNIVKNFFEKND